MNDFVQPTDPRAPQAQTTPRETRLTLIGILLGLFLAALDQTIVSTALPRIIADLKGTELYAWVTTAYLLTATFSAPIFGRLTELFSRKAILLVAIGIFLAGSALSGLAQNMPELIFFRGIQGIGGGALFALALTTIAVLFPPRERGKVGGLFGAIFGVSSALGPWLGGLLTDHLSWHWVFYINMPVGAVALWFILRFMPRLSPERRERFDFLGAGLLILWTVPLMLAFSWGGSTYPWLSAPILGLFALSALALALWVWSQNREPHPLFDLSVLRIRSFSLASAATFFYGPAFLGAVAFLPLYLQVVKGVSASASGVTVLPLTLGVVLGASGSGVLSGRLGRFKPLLLAGTLWLLLIFTVLHFVLSVDTPLWQAVLFFFLLGLGLGPAQSLLQIAAQNNVPPERIGSATAFTQLMRQIGSTIGIAVLGTVLSHNLTAETCKVFPQDAACKLGVVASRSNEGGTGLNLDEQFARLEAQVVAALKGDTQAYQALLQDPQVPQEAKNGLIEGGIPAQFRQLEARLVAALQGDEKAYAALMADPNLPAEFRARLVKGGIPAQFQELESQLEAALKGSMPAYNALIRNPQVPAELKARLTPGGIPAQFRALEAQFAAALEGDVKAYTALINNPQLPEAFKARLTKGGIPALFQEIRAQLLAALKGDAQAYQAVQQNPLMPAEFKARIPKEGVATQVQPQLEQTLGLLQAALQGDARAAQALRRTPNLDPRIQNLLDNPPPAKALPAVLAQVRVGLEAQSPKIIAAVTQQASAQIEAGLQQAQQQALAQALAGVKAGLAQAQLQAEAAAVAAVRENLQKAQANALEKALQATRDNLVVAEQKALQEVPKQVVAKLEEIKNKLHEALNNGITRAEKEIFLYAAFFVLISLLFILPLPNEELRGRGGMAGA
ncbi:MDR family MFS transporter [Calidithermus roseus]|uniref:Multidrug resistance protein 3 n=1 Tax=Calidithermus roseus TaxID=1644118 RepID=A0A399F0U5_9DEIN|nr:MDR family MFS transporter [Calidithermus roseus]RIH89673.1 Multidrug resistance protein 3 [Calidithermus roseus]